MRINQVCKQIGITKKAIIYYEKQGLISVPKDDNGYRNFNSSHIKSLNEITLYRKLNISTVDIADILQSDSKQEVLESIANQKKSSMRDMMKQQSYLERILVSDLNENEIENLVKEISESEREDENFILKRLKEFFPNGFGLILSNHFANFKFDKIQTKEQNEAWMEIVNFLDGVVEFEISEVMLNILGDMEISMIKEIHYSMKDEVMNGNLDKEKIESLKIDRDDIFSTIEELAPETHREFIKFQTALKKFFESESYKTNVINNIKILSCEYAEYHNTMMNLGQEFT